MPIDLKAYTEALQPTILGLEAAGFEPSLSEDSGRLQLKIAAGAQACEDCLVPKQLMRQMAADEIKEAGLAEIETVLLYPIDLRRK